jgi:uncharacterized membrane protein YhfC
VITGTIAAFVLSLLLQVGYPLAAMLLFRRRTRAPWRIFVYGAFAFAVFQLFSWLPLSFYLDVVVGGTLKSPGAEFAWMLALSLVGCLAEESGRWVAYRYLFPRHQFALNWRNGVALGLGHSALESMLFIAGLTLIYFLAYLALARADVTTLLATLGAEASTELRDPLAAVVGTTWEQPLLVAAERVLALPHQVAWSLLVMQSLVYRQKRWFALAVLYHVAVALIVPGLARLASLAAAEAVNVALAALSVWIIYRLYLLSGRESWVRR